MSLTHEIERRRTFAIISHPDAGKTTLTEKLLLYAGAVHVAGTIKARKSGRHALSDWMKMEQERGISITSSVLQFDHGGCRMNLVDTPGHADFSEDTFRALAAVDGAIMLMDAMKGIEARTQRLFEVCRLRDLPTLTFINKMDRPGRDPLELLDAVASTFDIGVTPLNWPIGSGPDFHGVLDVPTRTAHIYDRVEHGATVAPERRLSLDDPALEHAVGSQLHDELQEAALLIAAYDRWDKDRYLAGQLTPFLFGSAHTNFGVSRVLDALAALAPPPGPRPVVDGARTPTDEAFSAFVFKIQANMNPRHRDRVAFARIVSGRFERGMEVVNHRTGKVLRLTKPHSFMADDRALVDEAVAGDIVGLFDPGELRIADTLYVGEPVAFEGIPRFAPEHFARVVLKDPTRRKHLKNGLTQLSQEGAVQLFQREGLQGDPYLGAVGLLQFEVLKERLKVEYNVKADLERTQFVAARWVAGAPAGLAWLQSRPDYEVVRDRDELPVVLAKSPWTLNYAAREVPGLKLLEFSPLEALHQG